MCNHDHNQDTDSGPSQFKFRMNYSPLGAGERHGSGIKGLGSHLSPASRSCMTLEKGLDLSTVSIFLAADRDGGGRLCEDEMSGSREHRQLWAGLISVRC